MEVTNTLVSVFYDKKCFGTNGCWNQVKAKCPVHVECALKARAEKLKEALDKVKEAS